MVGMAASTATLSLRIASNECESEVVRMVSGVDMGGHSSAPPPSYNFFDGRPCTSRWQDTTTLIVIEVQDPASVCHPAPILHTHSCYQPYTGLGIPVHCGPWLREIGCAYWFERPNEPMNKRTNELVGEWVNWNEMMERNLLDQHSAENDAWANACTQGTTVAVIPADNENILQFGCMILHTEMATIKHLLTQSQTTTHNFQYANRGI